MSDEPVDRARDNFQYFSNEYAQALQAFKAIESQAETLMVLGVSDDLRTFILQFIEMASRTRAMAQDQNEPHFAEWFDELIAKAEGMLEAIAR